MDSEETLGKMVEMICVFFFFLIFDSLDLLRFRFKRAAELKHGRVAMLAAWMHPMCLFGFLRGVKIKVMKC